MRRFLTEQKNCSSETKILVTTTTEFPEQEPTTSSAGIPGFLTSDFNETNDNVNTIATTATSIFDEKRQEISRDETHKPEISREEKHDIQHEIQHEIQQEIQQEIQENLKFNEVTTFNSDKRNATPPKSRVSGDFKFHDVPRGGRMTTPDLQLDDGYVLFSFFSFLVDGMQTADYPAGLFKDWIMDRLSFAQVIIQAIRVEGGIIACVIVFVISAMALPFAVLAHTSCRFHSDEETPSSNEFSETQMQYKKLVLVAVFDIMIILFPLGMVGMFLSNEHLSHSMLNSQKVSNSVIDDMNTFVRNSHLQIRFVATTTMDQAVDATIADLEDIEDLLGRPIQKELATETGIDIALDALLDISYASTDIATDVLTLRAEAQAARETSRTTQDRLKDFRKQVETAKRQCVDKDRLLCDTIDTIGLDVIFNVDKLLAERKLSKLRHLGEDNLTSAASDARKTYQNIPQRIMFDTSLARQEIKMILRKQREKLYAASEALEEVSHDFSTSIDTANNYVSKIVETVTSIEQWRWLTGLVASLSMLLIWILLIIGAVFIHTNNSRKIFPLLLTLIILICTLSMLLWTLSSVTILAGGNGRILLCKPLYDNPNFASLTLLLDNPGMIYKDGGLFSNILNGNTSIDVPIKVVLSECRLNQPVFPTFNLNRIFNVDSLTNHLRWPKLHTHIYNISSTVNVNDTQILKPTLQKYLQDISSASRVNLTYYRSQLSGSVTQTDLNTFADQLERIAGQIVDVQTQARMETLAARARKLLANNLERLEKHRDEIVYKITALELKLLPLQRQANQSLSHLKTIQFYFLNQGSHISETKSKEYISRLIKYLERFREHVHTQLTYEVAPCRPLWDIFITTRSQICNHIVDPLNGFWASTIWCLLLFFILTPILMSLLEQPNHHMATNGDLRRDLNELLITDQGPWTTPHSTTPESIVSPDQNSWASTPRRCSDQQLIPSITITGNENSPPQPSSLKKVIGRRLAARSRLHESLKMTESSTPKSASTFNIPSPRGWL